MFDDTQSLMPCPALVAGLVLTLVVGVAHAFPLGSEFDLTLTPATAASFRPDSV